MLVMLEMLDMLGKRNVSYVRNVRYVGKKKC